MIGLLPATTVLIKEIEMYARGIGPNKNLVAPRDSEGNLPAPTSLVKDAPAAGLRVHPWTLRDEDEFLPRDLLGDPRAEYELFYRLGVDGVFSGFPGTAALVRDAQYRR